MESLIVVPVLDDHRAHPPEKPDLVSIMLEGRDKETGKGLPDDNIKYNVSKLLTLKLFVSLPFYNSY